MSRADFFSCAEKANFPWYVLLTGGLEELNTTSHPLVPLFVFVWESKESKKHAYSAPKREPQSDLTLKNIALQSLRPTPDGICFAAAQAEQSLPTVQSHAVFAFVFSDHSVRRRGIAAR